MSPSRLGPAWWIVAAGCLVGILVVLFGSFRVGGYVIAGSLVFGAAARAVLPESLAAGISIRTRWVDVFFFMVAAIALVVIFTQVRLGPAY